MGKNLGGKKRKLILFFVLFFLLFLVLLFEWHTLIFFPFFLFYYIISLSLLLSRRVSAFILFLSFSPYTPPIFFHAFARVHARTHTHHTHIRDPRTLFSTTSSFDKPLSKPHRISIPTCAQPHIISMSISLLSLFSLSGSWKFFIWLST